MNMTTVEKRKHRTVSTYLPVKKVSRVTQSPQGKILEFVSKVDIDIILFYAFANIKF